MKLDFDRWATTLRAFADFAPIAILLGAGIFITIITAFPGSPLQAWATQINAGVIIGILTLVAISGASILMKIGAIERALKDDALARIGQRIAHLSGKEKLVAADLSAHRSNWVASLRTGCC